MLQNQTDRGDRQPAVPSARRASPVLVEGPIARTLLLFSLPILGSSVLQSLNGSINAAWIGRLIGASALSASANANSIMFFLMSAGFGMGMAATILVGQALGARNADQAKKTIGTTFVFFSLVSMIIGILGFFLTPHMLAAMGTPDARPYGSPRPISRSSSSPCRPSIFTPLP